MAADFNPAKAGETHQQREVRGKKVADLAAQHKLHLTTSQQRSWYEDTWTETVVDWAAVADLLDKVAPGWDAPGVKEAPVVQASRQLSERDRDILETALYAFSRDRRRNKHARERAAELASGTGPDGVRAVAPTITEGELWAVIHKDFPFATDRWEKLLTFGQIKVVVERALADGVQACLSPNGEPRRCVLWKCHEAKTCARGVPALELSREDADDMLRRAETWSKMSEARDLLQAAFLRGVAAARGMKGLGDADHE